MLKARWVTRQGKTTEGEQSREGARSNDKLKWKSAYEDLGQLSFDHNSRLVVSMACVTLID